MEQTKKTKKGNPIQAVLTIALVLLVVVILVVALGGKKKSAGEAAAIQSGLDFLTQQEQKNPEPIRQARTALFNRRIEEQKDELYEKLTSGEMDPFSLLPNFVVMGDSRTHGFAFWEFLPEEQVLWGNGYKIFNIPEWYDKLKQMQPQYIFLLYGVNDCACQYWSSGEEHAADYMEYVREIQQMLPDSKIIVSSILLVQDFAIEDYPDWKYLPDWNAALKAACKEAGVLFADCDFLFEEYSHLWSEDGFHFDGELYPYWTSKLVITALYGDMDEEG